MSPIFRPISPANLSLYLVANRPSHLDLNIFFAKILDAVKGGVSCVQLRDHEADFYTALKTASYLKMLLNNTPLFINTQKSLEVAQTIGAAGVYLEDKTPYALARKFLGPKAIIGISVTNSEELMAAGMFSDIDYISVKITPSKRTCPINSNLWGMEGLRWARATTPHRIVAIGGITIDKVEKIYSELNMDDGIAMAGGLMREDNPLITAHKIQMIRQQARGLI